MSLWDTVNGPLLKLKGKFLILLTVILLWALWFLPTQPMLGKGMAAPPLRKGDN